MGLIFACSFFVYAHTLCPTVYFGDSGELASAAYTLGIAHSPGYPLYCLLGRAAIGLLPGDSPAVRLNLLSALLASLALAFLYRAVAAAGVSRAVSAAVSLAAGFSPGLWQHAVVAEVYALDALILTGTLALLFVWLETGKGRLIPFLGVVIGLGCANVPHFVLTGLAVAVFVSCVKPHVWRRGGGGRLAALLFLV